MKTIERIIAEALILGADVVEGCEEDLKGHVHMVHPIYCPYCGLTNTTMEDATAHDGECAKHPMAVRALAAEQRIAALEAANRTATAEIETLQFEVGRLGGQNAKLKAAALAVAKEPWGSTSEAHHFERMAKMDALRKMLGVNPHV